MNASIFSSVPVSSTITLSAATSTTLPRNSSTISTTSPRLLGADADGDQGQVALDVRRAREVADADDRDELGQLLADLVERVVVGDDDDRHAGELRVLGPADDERVDVEPAGREHVGDVRPARPAR